MVSFYDHRVVSYAGRGDDRGHSVLPEATLEEHQNPDYEAEPFYWIPLEEFERRLSDRPWTRPWLMGWRDISNATNERTVTPVVFPRIAVGHTIRVMFAQSDIVNPILLPTNLGTLVLDYVGRLKVGSIHLTVETLKQLPVIPPSNYTQREIDFLIPRVLELTYTSHSMQPFATDLGYSGPPFGWDPNRRAQLRAEIDACYAIKYGLTRDELRYVLEPADVVGKDYPTETFRGLRKNEIKEFGEYRTRRLVLEAYDKLVAGT